MQLAIPLYAVLFAALFAGVYTLTLTISGVPPRAAVKSLKRSGEKKKKSLLKSARMPLIAAISQLVRVPVYRRAKLKADLKRVGIDQTPEQYIASAWTSALLTGLLVIPCVIIGSAISAVGILALAAAVYFQELQRIDRALEDLDDRIVAELPHFVRSLTVGIEIRLPLSDAVATYLEAKPESAMRQELLQLISSLGLGNQRDALLAFEDAIALPALRTVVPVLIAVTEGTGDNGQLIILANQMDVLAEERLDQELLKRPAKIRKATIAIMVCALMMMIVPLLAQIINGLAVTLG